jgi:polysaccharide export outer membrane protein
MNQRVVVWRGSWWLAMAALFALLVVAGSLHAESWVKVLGSTGEASPSDTIGSTSAVPVANHTPEEDLFEKLRAADVSAVTPTGLDASVLKEPSRFALVRDSIAQAPQDKAANSGTQYQSSASVAGESVLPSPSTTSAVDRDSRLDCPYGLHQSGTPYICGVDCGGHGAPCCATWDDARYIPWSLFGPGEYVGPARKEHVPTYYLRVNDVIRLTFITSRRKTDEPYRIGVGDRLRIESSVDETLARELVVQPDGRITLPLVGEVLATGKTVQDLRDDLTEEFGKFQRQPHITVTPLEVNSGLQEIVKAVTSSFATSGQNQELRVTPEGTIHAPGLGAVYAQGLTIDELRAELEARYAATYGPGLLVSPSLVERATSFVFVGGEVRLPGRYTLEGPTTVMQAIALAGGWNVGGNVRQVVVFRRDENWCLKATMIDVHRPLYGKDPCPVNDVWLRDNDLVIVPKSRILCATDVINLYFTRGVYAVFPINFVYDFSTGSGVVPVSGGGP